MLNLNTPEVLFDRLIVVAVLFGIGYIIYKRAIGQKVNINFDMGKFTKYHRK